MSKAESALRTSASARRSRATDLAELSIRLLRQQIAAKHDPSCMRQIFIGDGI